jgi:hypothetical protein
MLNFIIKFFAKFVGEFFGFLVTLGLFWCSIVLLHIFLSELITYQAANWIAGSLIVIGFLRFAHLMIKEYHLFIS